MKLYLCVFCGNVNVNIYFFFEVGCLMWFIYYLVLEWCDKFLEDIFEDWNFKFFFFLILI